QMVILRNLRAVCSALILLGLSGNVAWSQSAKTIKILVPFPPGGSATILARLLAEQISRVHGPTILIENRPGAGASIGYEAIARALPDAVTALLGGHVTSVLGNYSEVIEQLEARKLRALAATSSTRIEPLPNLPTVAESCYKGYDVQVWFGLIAPAK